MYKKVRPELCQRFYICDTFANVRAVFQGRLDFLKEWLGFADPRDPVSDIQID